MYDEDPPTLFRLNALMKAGFEIDEAYSQHLEDSLQLKHPAMKRLKDYELTLYPDGLLVGPFVGEQLRIEPGQQKEFKSFACLHRLRKQFSYFQINYCAGKSACYCCNEYDGDNALNV